MIPGAKPPTFPVNSPTSRASTNALSRTTRRARSNSPRSSAEDRLAAPAGRSFHRQVVRDRRREDPPGPAWSAYLAAVYERWHVLEARRLTRLAR